tara:strand:+ start:260 stop:550 length:291 start_codon:yes stop_codon:yes gene_type:complete
MIHKISVENIKCGGCANTIEKKLLKNSWVTHVDINVETGEIAYEIPNNENTDQNIAKISSQLTSIGYPEMGSVQGFKSKTAKAKSFISCAIGKVSK